MPAASAQLTDFVSGVDGNTASASNRPGLLARAVRAIHKAQTRRAEREIARFIESHGARMTDDLERKIERHFA